MSLQYSVMMEEQRKKTDNRGNNFNYEFYKVIRNEDLESIEVMSKQYGSNVLIDVQGYLSGRVFWKGCTSYPLHLAASYRRLKSMQSLLSTGANTETKDNSGKTPLHLVIPSWMRRETRAKPDSKFGTVVTEEHRHADACLRLLCEHGANVNAQVEDQSRQTVLHISVHYRALSAVQILTSYGADVNALDSYGKTPLHMAAGMLDKDIITSLISQGADINMGVQHSGNTPLHLAVVAVATKTTKTTDNDISCIIELLEQGAKPNMMNKAGVTPLQEACSMRNEELVDLLLRYGGNINKLNKAGENCLFLFLDHRPKIKNSSLLMKLLSLTSPLTIFDQNGRLPSTLTQPCFFKQRDQLLRITQQPRRLGDICKCDVYLKYVGGRYVELRKVLPESLYDFVFNHWKIQHITFMEDCE
ncbi:ankyrin repeat domain-containing protein 61-like [Melanotaenia boesemani]|uniref:ankyrin repeat domain-containing protein 61-like n=1 Tax=Melanotaenia boesemani TaxID=1250792 RepID=UPI001C048512|nr:ankyrin repeat domain-containing protein 61-like [Melanotaenia boesemani]